MRTLKDFKTIINLGYKGFTIKTVSICENLWAKQNEVFCRRFFKEPECMYGISYHSNFVYLNNSSSGSMEYMDLLFQLMGELQAIKSSSGHSIVNQNFITQNILNQLNNNLNLVQNDYVKNKIQSVTNKIVDGKLNNEQYSVLIRELKKKLIEEKTDVFVKKELQEKSNLKIFFSGIKKLNISPKKDGFKGPKIVVSQKFDKTLKKERQWINVDEAQNVRNVELNYQNFKYPQAVVLSKREEIQESLTRKYIRNFSEKIIEKSVVAEKKLTDSIELRYYSVSPKLVNLLKRDGVDTERFEKVRNLLIREERRKTEISNKKYRFEEKNGPRYDGRSLRKDYQRESEKAVGKKISSSDTKRDFLQKPKETIYVKSKEYFSTDHDIKPLKVAIGKKVNLFFSGVQVDGWDYFIDSDEKTVGKYIEDFSEKIIEKSANAEKKLTDSIELRYYSVSPKLVNLLNWAGLDSIFENTIYHSNLDKNYKEKQNSIKGLFFGRRVKNHSFDLLTDDLKYLNYGVHNSFLGYGAKLIPKFHKDIGFDFAFNFSNKLSQKLNRIEMKFKDDVLSSQIEPSIDVVNLYNYTTKLQSLHRTLYDQVNFVKDESVYLDQGVDMTYRTGFNLGGHFFYSKDGLPNQGVQSKSNLIHQNSINIDDLKHVISENNLKEQEFKESEDVLRGQAFNINQSTKSGTRQTFSNNRIIDEEDVVITRRETKKLINLYIQENLSSVLDDVRDRLNLEMKVERMRYGI